MTKRARVLKRITRPNFCGTAGSTEYYVVDDLQIQMIPVVDCPSAKVGDVIEFQYVAVGNGYRWMPQ